MTLRSFLFFALACIAPVFAAEADFASELGASSVEGIAGQRDNKLIVAGYFNGITAPGEFTILRLNAEGSVDPNFQRVRIFGDYARSVGPIALQANEKVLFGGRFTSAAGVPRTNLVRLDTNGVVDLSFNANQALSDSYAIHDIVPLSDGRILVAGRISAPGGRISVVRLLSDGSLDSTFKLGVQRLGPNGVDDLELLEDGGFLAAGWLAIPSGGLQPPEFATLARFRADGSHDSNFRSAIRGGVSVIRRLGDGKILVAGAFAREGDARNHLARLNTDGSLDPEFNPGAGPNGNVYLMAVEPSGKIWIGGLFTAIDGLPRNGLARLNANGSVDETVAAPNFGSQSALVAIGDNVLFGGTFPGGVILLPSGQAPSAPRIISQPASTKVRTGNNAIFESDASGFPLTFQWQRDGTDIPGATNGILVIYEVTAGMAGAYRLMVSNSMGTVISEPAVLAVIAPIEGPELVLNPSFEQLSGPVSEPGSFKFSGVAGWTGSGADIFTGPANVPDNYMGRQPPFHGTNYAGKRALYPGYGLFTGALTGALATATTPARRYLLSAAFARAELTLPDNLQGPEPLPIRPATVEVLLTDGITAPLSIGKVHVSDTTNWTVLEKVVLAGKAYRSVLVRSYNDPSLPEREFYFYVDAVSLIQLADAPLELVSVGEVRADVGDALLLTNRLAEIDVLDEGMVFSLEAGAPPIMHIDPVTGVLRWTPSLLDAATTNRITVRATHRASSATTAAQTFSVIVGDALRIELGGSVGAVGDTISVPVNLFLHSEPEAAVTNLVFDLIHPPEVNELMVVPEQNGGVFPRSTRISDTVTRVSLAALPEARMGMANPAAHLRFSATATEKTFFIPWQLAEVQATKTDGAAVDRAFATIRRSLIVGEGLALEALHSETGPLLRIYGPDGVSFNLETAPEITKPQVWQTVGRMTLTNLWQDIKITNNGSMFYRAWR